MSVNNADEYTPLMRRWVRAGSPFAECVREQAAALPRSPSRDVVTVGVEGAGHHMVEQLPLKFCNFSRTSVETRATLRKQIPLERLLKNPGPRREFSCDGDLDSSLCTFRSTRHGCGGQMSLPSDKNWRLRARAKVDLASCDDFARHEKRLFLVRDPVDTFTSSLARWWREPKLARTILQGAARARIENHANDTLRRELYGHYRGWQRMDECSRKLPCGSSLILCYRATSSSRCKCMLFVDDDD